MLGFILVVAALSDRGCHGPWHLTNPSRACRCREVDRLGERLQPLGRALLPALEAAQRGGGRRRSFEVAVALLHQHQASLLLLTMSCSFMFEGTIPATAGALRGVADGYAAILPALVLLMQAVRQQCQPARDGRLLGGFVMQHCDSLWRTVGCFVVACSGQEWPLFEAALPADVAQPWIQELITWADLSAPHREMPLAMHGTRSPVLPVFFALNLLACAADDCPDHECLLGSCRAPPLRPC